MDDTEVTEEKKMKICPVMSGPLSEDESHYSRLYETECIGGKCQWWWKCRNPDAQTTVEL